MDVLQVILAVGEFKDALHNAGLHVSEDVSCAINELVEYHLAKQTLDDAAAHRLLQR